MLQPAQKELRPVAVAAAPKTSLQKKLKTTCVAAGAGPDVSVSSNSVPSVEPIITYYSFLVRNHPHFQNYMPFVNLTEECDTGDLIGTRIVHNKPYKLAD